MYKGETDSIGLSNKVLLRSNTSFLNSRHLESKRQLKIKFEKESHDEYMVEGLRIREYSDEDEDDGQISIVQKQSSL